MTRKAFAINSMPILGAVVLVIGLAVNAQERPRIMPSPRPTLAPTYGAIVYRDNGSLQLRANLYLPESDQPTVAIAWFAGGGFRLRDYRMIRGSIFDQFARGVAVISFEYTLADEAKWPAQAHDGKAAIRWLRANAKQYNIDPSGFSSPEHQREPFSPMLLQIVPETNRLRSLLRKTRICPLALTVSFPFIRQQT